MSSYFRPDGLGYSWLEIAGTDAREYLHRLTTVDARALKPGQGAPGLFLNAQGKIQGSFRLWCLEDARFAFELEAGADGSLKQSLLNWIEQYHFGEKFEVTDSGLSCLWLLGLEAEHASALPGDWTTASGQGLRINHAGNTDYGRPFLTLWGETSQLNSWLKDRLPNANAVSLETLERWRIEALSPRSGHELTQDSSPLEAGFDRAIAMNKGCYPGQEVIEKTISLGQPAQRLVRLEGKGEAPALGTAVTNQASPPASVGRITSAVKTDEGFLALAFVRKIHAKEGLEVRLEGGAPAKIAAVSQLVAGTA
jgi:folate-binding protein YgfZ